MEIVWQTPANPPQAEDYIIRKGKRYVKPYYFEFISHVKNRWAGKTIVDLFAEEFKGRPYEYYVGAVKSGRIQVDGKMVHVGYVVQSSQKTSHFLHRHEPPVLAGNVSVLHSDSDVITVFKPASVPVHPCGQYRKNTVVGILEAEHDLAPIFPVHRLDRLVSGLLIFARNAVKAEQFRQQIEAGLLQKEYIAKVIGVFPEDEQMVDANVNYDACEGKSSVEIRVHLQHTGYPIANDMLYLSETAVPRSTQGMSSDRADVTRMNKLPFGFDDDEFAEVTDMHLDEEFSIDPMCTNCPDLAPKGYGGSEEGLWLHCLRYSGPDWTYECPYPEWARHS